MHIVNKADSFEASHILIYGVDAPLLYSRRLLFESRGLVITTTMSLEEFRLLVTSQPFDLIVLCHSLHPPQREGALDAANAQQPEVITLILNTFREPDYRGRASEVFLNAMEGPRAMLAIVGTLLNRAMTRTPLTQ